MLLSYHKLQYSTPLSTARIFSVLISNPASTRRLLPNQNQAEPSKQGIPSPTPSTLHNLSENQATLRSLKKKTTYPHTDPALGHLYFFKLHIPHPCPHLRSSHSLKPRNINLLRPPHLPHLSRPLPTTPRPSLHPSLHNKLLAPRETEQSTRRPTSQRTTRQLRLIARRPRPLGRRGPPPLRARTLLGLQRRKARQRVRLVIVILVLLIDRPRHRRAGEQLSRLGLRLRNRGVHLRDLAEAADDVGAGLGDFADAEGGCEGGVWPGGRRSAVAGDGALLESLERHVGLAGSDLVVSQAEAETEDFGFLRGVVSWVRDQDRIKVGWRGRSPLWLAGA